MTPLHRALLVVCAFCLYAALALASQAQSFTALVQKHDTYDTRGIRLYELRFSDGGAVTISGSSSVHFIQALEAAQGKQTLTIEAFALSKVER